MAAHAPSVPRRSHWYLWLTWSLLLIPLVQLALTAYLPNGNERPGIAILEALVLWWAGCCATISSPARGDRPRRTGWLVLAALLFIAAANQLIALHSAGEMSALDLGLGVGLGLLLLLSTGALVHAVSAPGAGLAQAGFEALCLISATLVIRASIEPFGRDAVPSIEPVLATTVLAGLIVLVGVAFTATIQPRAPAVLVPLSLGLACLLSSAVLTIWRTELAVLVGAPLRTLAWALLAIGAVTAHVRLEPQPVTLKRPTLAGIAAPLLSWTVIALALITVVATRAVHVELLALVVTGTLREVVAVLRRVFREDDLVLALLWERRRLNEERGNTLAL